MTNNIDELEIQNLNAVDMECQLADDDDSFAIVDGDDRNLCTKTGIIIDLSDDESLAEKSAPHHFKPFLEDDAVEEKILPTITPESLDMNFAAASASNSLDLANCKDFNEIDLETDFRDDTEDDDIGFENDTQPLVADADDTYYQFDDELDEKYESVLDSGKVSKNYLSDLAKKHKKTNVKGSYNNHFHLAGDPELGMKMFNHDAEAHGITADAASATADVSSSAAGESVSESLNECKSTMQDVFAILGFELHKNNDNSFTLVDNCNDLPDTQCANASEVLAVLHPYILDCFIYPLQIKTGENFEKCDDWVNWWKSADVNKFADCSDDICYCSSICNDLNDYLTRK